MGKISSFLTLEILVSNQLSYGNQLLTNYGLMRLCAHPPKYN